MNYVKKVVLSLVLSSSFLVGQADQPPAPAPAPVPAPESIQQLFAKKSTDEQRPDSEREAKKAKKKKEKADKADAKTNKQ